MNTLFVHANMEICISVELLSEVEASTLDAEFILETSSSRAKTWRRRQFFYLCSYTICTTEKVQFMKTTWNAFQIRIVYFKKGGIL